MPQAYRAILVANDKLVGLDAALAKAAVLEHYNGAELTLLEVIYDELEKESDTVLEKAEKDRLITAFIAAERHALTQIADSYSEKVASLNTAVSWSENREQGICRYAIRHQIDLIVRPLNQDHSPLEVFRHSSVHRLLAQAACPVLISQVPDWDDNTAILACVDVRDAEHQRLNESIVQHALALAELLNVPLHLLNVAPGPQLSLGRFSSTFDVSAMQARMLAEREQELQRLRANLKESTIAVDVHVKTGSLVDEVKSVAHDTGARIVVMGTASREGLRRFLVGNSAEAALYRLDMDLLFVKENWLEHTEYGD